MIRSGVPMFPRRNDMKVVTPLRRLRSAEALRQMASRS